MEAATLTTETVTVPVHVNVVPGDQAAGRMPNPTVRSELAFQAAQKAKREATEAASAGDTEAASRIYNAAARNLQAFIPSADPEMAPELSEEQKLLDELSCEWSRTRSAPRSKRLLTSTARCGRGVGLLRRTADRVGRVKILTWNVNGRIEDAARRQIRAVLRRDPDIICLQEVTGKPGGDIPAAIRSGPPRFWLADIRS